MFSTAAKPDRTEIRGERKTSTAEPTAKPAPIRRNHVEQGGQPLSDEAKGSGRETMKGNLETHERN